MQRGVNKVILVGNLGSDPEIRYMPNGNAVANLNLATSESWKDQQGQLQERTEWHRLVMYRRLAEIAAEYLTKGAQIYVEGKLQTRKWQDEQGHDRYTTEIIVDQMQMLGGRSDNGSQTGYQSNSGYQQGGPTRSQSQRSNQRPNQSSQRPQNQNRTGGNQQRPKTGVGQGSHQQRPQNQQANPAQNRQPLMAELDFDFDDDVPFAPIGLQQPQLLNCI